MAGRVRESSIAHSVKEGKLDPPKTNVYSRRCNNVHHNSPARPWGRAKRTDFRNVTQVIGLSCNSF